jgi:hypothetical protein
MFSPFVWRVQFQQVEQLSMDSREGRRIQPTGRTLQPLPPFTSGKTGWGTRRLGKFITAYCRKPTPRVESPKTPQKLLGGNRDVFDNLTQEKWRNIATAVERNCRPASVGMPVLLV